MDHSHYDKRENRVTIVSNGRETSPIFRNTGTLHRNHMETDYWVQFYIFNNWKEIYKRVEYI